MNISTRPIQNTTVPLIILIAICLLSCNKNEIDDEPPVIIMNETHHFPNSCDTIYMGEAFVFRATFTDNKELGAFSIDIHQNFDHHSHSTEVEDCTLDLPKNPTDKVLLFIKSYDIPNGLTTYEAEVVIEVPDDVDAGDYHFSLSLTDREGWQRIRGVSIKVLERQP